MNKYYRKVPPELVDQFMRFRDEHSLKHTQISGISWEYLSAGNPSGQPLLILPGGLGTAESAWRMITQLNQDQYHLICPSYPLQIETMSGLADGIAILLELEGVQTAYVIGGAYGSMLAQVFVRRHPGMVDRLVLTHAYPPVKTRVVSVNPNLRLFKTFPMFMVRRFVRLQMTGKLSSNPSPNLLLLAAQIHETIDTRMTRQSFQNIYLRMMDFDQQEFSASDLATWQGKALIIEEEDDPTAPESLRNELMALYPRATLHLIQSTGRSRTLLDSEDYLKVIVDFLQADK